MTCQVPRSTLAARTRTRISSAPIGGLGDLGESQDVRGGAAVDVLDDRLHRLRDGACVGGAVGGSSVAVVIGGSEA